MERDPPAHRVAQDVSLWDAEAVEQGGQVGDRRFHPIARGVGGRVRLSVPQQIDGNRGETVPPGGDVRRPGGVAAAEAMQQQEGWPAALALDVILVVVDRQRFHSHQLSAFRSAMAALTAGQRTRWAATFSARSVRTSITVRPSPVRLAPTAERKASQPAGRTKRPPYISTAGWKSRPVGVPNSSSKWSASV